MTIKKVAAVVGALALIAAVVVFAASAVFAQADTPTPVPNTTPNTAPGAPFGGHMLGRGFGLFGGGGWATQFDALANALNLTPTQVFEQLHSGKTLDEIAKAQGVDLTKVQEAMNASRIQAMKDAIGQAVKDGKMTQEQADWLLQGLEKGYMGKGRGFGFEFGPMGRGGRGGMRGHGMQGPSQTPATPAPGTSS
jgi:hypothetical protein